MARKLVELILESNPSTGYKWTEVDGTSWGIQEVQSYYVHSSPTMTEEGDLLVGGGGKEHFQIWIKDYDYHLELVYCHPWEPENSTVDRVIVESVV